MLEQSSILEIVYYDENVFDANVNNSVFLLKKPFDTNNCIHFCHVRRDGDSWNAYESNDISQIAFMENEFLLIPPSNDDSSRIVTKMELSATLINEVARVNFGMQLRDRKEYPLDVTTDERTLQEDKVLVPMAYWQSKGLPRGGKKTQADPYKWCKTTIAKMLSQQEYCGDIINFKSTSKSFRNKTRVENPKENWAIFKDVHEPIIDRDTWEQVQKLVEKTKRRPPKDKNLKKSIFTSFLYCGDCGHKLWFNFNQKNPSIRFFSCSNYKGMRGTCENTHYIREDVLEQIVLMELRMLADFLESAEDDFAELLEQKTNKDMIRERTTAEGALSTARARSKKLLGLFQKLYEDNVEGKVTDEWFMQLSNKYEAEQEELKRQMFELQEKLDKIDQMQTAKDDFLRAIRKFMEMQTLTPILLRELIEKIEVFPVEGTGKDRTQRVIIHYRFVGRLDIPGIIQRPHYILDSRQGVAIEYLPNAI